MRQLTGAIYLSFGFFFHLLNRFEGYYPPVHRNWIPVLFILVGFSYLFIDFRSYVKKHFNS
ncbi:hypothetical protein METH109765_06070 [Mesobacillus thioparans]